MSPCFVLGRENVPCVAKVVNRLLKADCTDFTQFSLVNRGGGGGGWIFSGIDQFIQATGTKSDFHDFDFYM